MEYIKSTPVNLNVYIDEFHTRMKLEFEASINKIYKEEINVYSEVIETIVKLPFIQKIIDENKELKSRIMELESNSNSIKLEIIDKPVLKNVVDIESITFGKNVSNEDADDADYEGDSEDDSECDSECDSEDDSETDGEKSDKKDITEEEEHAGQKEIKPEERVEEEQSADEEEEEEEQSADEDNKPTFPAKKAVPETADEEDKEEPSADEEETSEVIEIEIDDKKYYCDDEENGNIYDDDEGEIGNIVGEIKNGEAMFFE